MAWNVIDIHIEYLNMKRRRIGVEAGVQKGFVGSWRFDLKEW